MVSFASVRVAGGQAPQAQRSRHAFNDHERERQANERQNDADDDEHDDPEGHVLTLSGTAMKFGIQVGHLGGPLDEMRRLWRFADERGFDWFSVSDHFQETPPQGGDVDCFESIATLTAAAKAGDLLVARFHARAM